MFYYPVFCVFCSLIVSFVPSFAAPVEFDRGVTTDLPKVYAAATCPRVLSSARRQSTRPQEAEGRVQIGTGWPGC